MEGRIPVGTYVKYFRSGGGVVFSLLVLFICVLSQVCNRLNYRIVRTIYKSQFFHSLAGGAPYNLERFMCEITNTLLPVYHFK